MESKTPLHIAIVEEETELVSDLISKGYDVNESFGKQTPLSMAVDTRNVDIIKLLLNAGADPYGKEQNLKKTPLYAAIKSNNVSILNLLLSAIGEHAKLLPLLHKAVKWGNSNIVKALIKSGADVNALNHNCYTPLNLSIITVNLKIVKLLIDSGANVNQSDVNGNQPLHVAACISSKNCMMKDIIEVLIQAGACVNKLNNYNGTPLKIFIKYNSDVDQKSIQKSFKLLIGCTDVNVKNVSGGNVVSDILSQLRFKKYAPKIIAHIAMLKKLNLNVDTSIIDSIFCSREYNNHYTECINELEKMKNTKLNKCWVTFFNLLVSGKTKLLRFAGNQDLVQDFNEKIDQFPIYKSWIRINIEEGIERRKLFDDATDILHLQLPIFRNIPLIIQEILDILSDDDFFQLAVTKK